MTDAARRTRSTLLELVEGRRAGAPRVRGAPRPGHRTRRRSWASPPRRRSRTSTACQSLVAAQVGSGGYLDDDDAGGAATSACGRPPAVGQPPPPGPARRRRRGEPATGRRSSARAASSGQYFETGPAFIDFFRGDYADALAGPRARRGSSMPEDALPIRRSRCRATRRATNRAHLVLRARRPLPVRRGAGARPTRRSPSRGELAVPGRPVQPLLRAGDAGLARGRWRRPRRGGPLHRRASLEVAERHGFTFWTIVGGFYDAYRELRAGVDGAGERAPMALDAARRWACSVWLPSFLAAVAAVALRRGDADGRRPRLASRPRGRGRLTGAHYWSAELARHEGEARARPRRRRTALDAAPRGRSRWPSSRARRCTSCGPAPRCADHTGDADDRAALGELLARLALDRRDAAARRRRAEAGARPARLTSVSLRRRPSGARGWPACRRAARPRGRRSPPRSDRGEHLGDERAVLERGPRLGDDRAVAVRLEAGRSSGRRSAGSRRRTPARARPPPPVFVVDQRAMPRLLRPLNGRRRPGRWPHRASARPRTRG